MPAPELAGPAEITRLELLCASAQYDSGVYNNFRLLLCPTTRAELSNNYEANYDGNVPMLVRSDDRLEVFWTEGAWDGFEFDSAFAYDGTSNLLIEFRWQGSDGRAVYTRGWYPPGGNRTLDGYSLTSPTGELRSYCVCLRIHYRPTGIADRPETARAEFLPALVRGHLYLPRETTETRPGTSGGVTGYTLLDPLGRKVMDLQPGENDVRHLSPGVYFVRAALWERSQGPPAVTRAGRDFVRKVVIQR